MEYVRNLLLTEATNCFSRVHVVEHFNFQLTEITPHYGMFNNSFVALCAFNSHNQKSKSKGNAERKNIQQQ